jgi:hypothetical protein
MMTHHIVMAGLVPAIHDFLRKEDVDARDKRGHDGADAVPLP